MTSTMRSMMTPRIRRCLTTYPCHFSRGHPDDIDNEEYDDTENKTLQLGQLVQPKHPPPMPPATDHTTRV